MHAVLDCGGYQVRSFGEDGVPCTKDDLLVEPDRAEM